ncbi:unnamed protein product [Effrenium voratum]|nr:unnamed protein product [Effrenium voratum]
MEELRRLQALQVQLLQHARAMSTDPAVFGGNLVIAIVIFSLMVLGAVYASIVQRWEERSQTTAKATLRALEETQFTPNLVVPEGCECILLVASRPKRGLAYDVVDSSGNVVLQVADDLNPVPRRQLLTPSNILLGQCTRSRRSFPSQTSATITFEISNANHEVYARLVYEPRQGADDKCVIDTKGQRLLFFGSIQHQTLLLGTVGFDGARSNHR